MRPDRHKLHLALGERPRFSLKETLDGALLCGADLRGIDLRGARLYGADLREADLRGADLRGALLMFAALDGADLRGARLSGAFFHGAYGCARCEPSPASGALRAQLFFSGELKPDTEPESPSVQRYLPQKRSLLCGGWRYHVESWAPVDESIAPLVAFHGMAGLGSDFEAFAAEWPGAFHAVELLGHGGSESPSTDALSSPEVVTQLGALCAQLTQGSSWGLIGYSMGGRLAAQLVAAHAPKLAAALLIGAHPSLEEEEARAARRAADARWVQLLLEEGTEAFLERWEAQPVLLRLQQCSVEQRSQRRARRLLHDPAGLAFAFQVMGLGALPSCREGLRASPIETCWLSGSEDLKFTKIAAEMGAEMSGGFTEIIEGAGHCPLLETPTALNEAARRFLLPRLRGLA